MTAKNPGVTMENWTGGVNSLLPPDLIATSEYSWLINGVNRGGIVQTRPGYDSIASIQGSKLQGGCVFTPKNSRPMMLIAVDGLIYAAKFPFKVFVKIEGLKFSSVARIITLQPVLKSVKLNPDGSLSRIDPMPLVIIQDGVTKAGVFDGANGVHSTPGTPFFGIPIGLWMEWTASRLWVFDKSRGFVSDLANPDTFSENTYIAERSNFELPGEVTGVIETSDEKSLLVFTENTTTSFQSNIRDRAQWSQTPEFQKVILPGIGCVAGRSTVNQYGLTWWKSQQGYINLDAALFTQRSNKLIAPDKPMMRSNRILSSDQLGICAAAFENFLLVSMPAGGRYNEQTWVTDQAPVNTEADTRMMWTGVWTGTRPVVWMKTEVGRRARLYFASFDATPKDGTQIHIWEAFKDDRRDNDGRVACQFETGMVKGQELHRFRYAELDLCEILGNVEMKVFVGGITGPWYQVRDTTFQAEIGSIGSSVQKTLTKESILEAFKPQSRIDKTDEFSPQDKPAHIETKNVPGRDKGFQILVEWKGRMGIKAIKIVMEEDSSEDSGQPTAGEAGGHNILTDAGETIHE